MSPDKRLTPEQSAEILRQSLAKIVYMPTEEDIKDIPNANLVPPETQINPYDLHFSSTDYVSITVPIPGVHGDTHAQLPDLLRKKGHTGIIAYRASHEGLLHIYYPNLTAFSDIAQILNIDIYSRSIFEDFTSSQYKRVSFLPDAQHSDDLMRTVGRFSHYITQMHDSFGTLKPFGFNTDATILDMGTEQMMQMNMYMGRNFFDLSVRPSIMKVQAESAYNTLRQSPLYY